MALVHLFFDEKAGKEDLARVIERHHQFFWALQEKHDDEGHIYISSTISQAAGFPLIFSSTDACSRAQHLQSSLLWASHSLLLKPARSNFGNS
jgi:hypothetical protein